MNHTLDTQSSRLAALRQAIGDSMENIRRAAEILSAMEQAGDDLSDIPAHLLRMLRRINTQQLLPEVMVRLSGTLRQKVASLPLPEQRRMIEPDCLLEVLLPDGHVAMLAPQRFTPDQVRQVFGDGFIRTPMEQRASLTPHSPARRPPGRPPKGTAGADIYVDKRRGGVLHFGHFITKAQMIRWISEL